jgi:hypothetical protein
MLRFTLVLVLLTVFALDAEAQRKFKAKSEYDGKGLKEWVVLLKHDDPYERQNAAFAIG